jgi:valyl-tRNA synthetase
MEDVTGGESLVIADWPQSSGITSDGVAAQRITDMQRLITEVRRFRSDQGLNDRQRVPARLVGVAGADLDAQVAAVGALAWLTDPADGFTPSASVEVRLSRGTVVVELDTSGTVDVAAERRRLRRIWLPQKELAQTAQARERAFLAKAPQDVVDKIRSRRELASDEVERINGRLAGLDESAGRDPLEPTPDEIAAPLQVEHLLDQRWPETKIDPARRASSHCWNCCRRSARTRASMSPAPTARPR